MTTEIAVIEGYQDIIQSLSSFADASVVINDWSVLDGKGLEDKSPFFIFEASEDFTSRQDTKTPNTIWQVPGYLMVYYTGMKETLDNLMSHRQEIVDGFNDDDHRSANGIEAVTCDVIRNITPLIYWYGEYVHPDDIEEAEPIFIGQGFVFETEEF